MVDFTAMILDHKQKVLDEIRDMCRDYYGEPVLVVETSKYGDLACIYKHPDSNWGHWLIVDKDFEEDFCSTLYGSDGDIDIRDATLKFFGLPEEEDECTYEECYVAIEIHNPGWNVL